ncbi:hypothetical protein KFZ56_00345 [Virgibacillus sp. NKC19-3]|uniref:hypothetical protein n=1 Tax=Virgibacillus saliphilus TaxID=2831674 RepID=UPI001C9AD500|nr:hypothetical protein [Virgibacillus sp. NKC19-3]MBY7141578.1 hypothetical protein [Virgibacillus sp. NKC19-3]
MRAEIEELSISRTEKLLNEALGENDTKLLVKELNINLDQIKEKGYTLQFIYENQEDKILETLLIYQNDEKVIEATKDYNNNAFKKIVAHYVDTNLDSKKIKRASVKNNQIHVLKELPYDHNYFDFFAENQKSNIEAQQDWYEGCLTFSDPATGRHYYRHCGADCGDDGSTGGGTPINSLDSCCRSHDRCYGNFGYNDCECDQILGDCANGTTDPGWWYVATWAYEKDCV